MVIQCSSPVFFDEHVLYKGRIKCEPCCLQGSTLKIICSDLHLFDDLQGIFGGIKARLRPDNDVIQPEVLRALPSSCHKSLELDVRIGHSYSVKAAAAPTHSAFIGAASSGSKPTYSDQQSVVPSVSQTSGRSDNIMECVLHSFVAENEPDQDMIYEDFDKVISWRGKIWTLKVANGYALFEDQQWNTVFRTQRPMQPVNSSASVTADGLILVLIENRPAVIMLGDPSKANGHRSREGIVKFGWLEDGIADEGYLVGYAPNSKAYRVYNLTTKRVEETFESDIFSTQDTDSGFRSGMKQVIVVPSFPSNSFSGPSSAMVLVLWNAMQIMQKSLLSFKDKIYAAKKLLPIMVICFTRTDRNLLSQAEAEIRNQGVSTDRDPAGIVSADSVSAGSSQPDWYSDPALVVIISGISQTAGSNDILMVKGQSCCLLHMFLDDFHSCVLWYQLSSGIFTSSSYDDDFSATLTNLAPVVDVNPVPTRRVNTIHPQSQILGDLSSPVLTRSRAASKNLKFRTRPRESRALVMMWSLPPPVARTRRQSDCFWPLASLYGLSGISVWLLRVVVIACMDFTATRACLDMESVRTATTPYEAAKTKLKDETDPPVNVHLYRSMIGSLMYLTASRPDIMFALEAYSDSDYAGSHGDRKSTTGGCQFLGKRLISWQCKKQTIVATSSTEGVDMVSCGILFSCDCSWFRVHAGGHTSAGGFISADGVCVPAVCMVFVCWLTLSAVDEYTFMCWGCLCCQYILFMLLNWVLCGSIKFLCGDLFLMESTWFMVVSLHSCCDVTMYPKSSVHVLDLTNGKTVYMFVDKIYPIRATLLELHAVFIDACCVASIVFAACWFYDAAAHFVSAAPQSSCFEKIYLET
ncbi:putative ribonuclease H-like domain-containing protein [Tanacetum coccineum]